MICASNNVQNNSVCCIKCYFILFRLFLFIKLDHAFIFHVVSRTTNLTNNSNNRSSPRMNWRICTTELWTCTNFSLTWISDSEWSNMSSNNVFCRAVTDKWHEMWEKRSLLKKGRKSPPRFFSVLLALLFRFVSNYLLLQVDPDKLNFFITKVL